mgnify:CR=1 FL=1
MFLYLQSKLLGVAQRSQRVGIGLGEELHTAGASQLLHGVDKLGHIDFELFESHTRNGECHLELAVGVLYHFEKGLIGGQVRTMGNTGDNLVVVIIVVVIMVVTDIEETITFQPERLGNLKVKTDGFHIQ